MDLLANMLKSPVAGELTESLRDPLAAVVASARAASPPVGAGAEASFSFPALPYAASPEGDTEPPCMSAPQAVDLLESMGLSM